MPRPDRGSVREAAAALRLDLADETADALLQYLALLERWNATYNLTAVRDPAAMWIQHVVDCLAAVPSVDRRLAAQAAPRVLDVGSGAGLPGIVWALALPQVRLVCVDAVAKKVAFLQQAVGVLGLRNLQARHARVEALDEPPFELITSRAYAALRDFVAPTARLLAPGGAWVAMKGRRPDDEIRALPVGVRVFHVEPLAVPGLSAERCLVWIEKSAPA